MLRLSRSTLRSAPVATLMVASLALWGCGGGGGGGGSGGSAGGAAGHATGGSSGGHGGSGTGTGGSTATGGAGGGVTGLGGSVIGSGGASATGGAGGSATGGVGGVHATGGAGGAAVGGSGGGGGAAAGGSGGAPSCTTSGAACTASGGVHGVCTSGTCQGCTSDGMCSDAAAYGTGYICLAASGDCVMGTCHNNADCNGKICGTAHSCGSCASVGDCTTAYGAGYVCQTSTGKCVQGNCNTNADCNGGICNGSTCAGCGTDDSACVTAYGTGYICVSGACMMGTCHTGANCTGGQICTASHLCASCTDDPSCQASYTDGRICVNSQCVIGNCHDSSQCSNGQICSNSTCIDCTNDNQCASGQLCLSGGCTTGNCRTAADCKDATKVCSGNLCSACSINSDCTAAYGSDHVCNGGSCISGNCLKKGDCAASGLVCGAQTANFCGTCSGDAQCVTEYGGGHICNGTTCVTGTCHDSNGCGTGQVCDPSSHTCVGCGSGTTGDSACKNDAKYGSAYICQANACIMGNCHAAADCGDVTKVCTNFTCGGCSGNGDCTNAYGANHVCSGGQCVSGSCNSSSECGGNQLCVSHACVACTAGATGDMQCKQDTTYGAMHICLGGQCVAGDCHDTSTECNPGQICGATVNHTCGGCGSGSAGDTACKNDTTAYGTGYICLANGCVQGDCHDTSNDCTAGKICSVSTHTCGNCGGGNADMQCTSDSRYGSGDICYQGLCGPGNCHAVSSDCTGTNAGLICGVNMANTCGPCTSDSQCRSDPFYTSSDICNPSTGQCVSAACSNNNAACSANGTDFCCSGTCTAGSCCVDNDCGAAGTACVNHTCTACNAVSGNKWYVDPVNGNDLTATGSGMSGSTVAPGCAFKTITQAIAHMPATPFAGSQIVIVGSSGSTTGLSSGDTLPLILPTNTTLSTSGGPVTITVVAGGAFKLNNNNSGISGGSGAPLVLDGNSHAGGIAVLVSPGTSTFTSNISNVTIQNTNSDGIRVTAGTLTVGGGVVVSGSNSDGIRISGGAANITNLSGTQTLFTGNASHGIEVSGLGSVNVSATPGSPVPSNGGTVVCTNNTTAGIRINQTPGASGLATNTIDGLVAWGNSNYGMRLFGGSKVKVRNSLFLANVQYGVIVGGANSVAGEDLSGLDLGVAGDPGKNYLQVPLGSAGLNASGGLCVALTNCAGAFCPLTENLSAEGNFMVSASGNLQVDCSTSTSAITKGTCGGLRSDGINAATSVTTTVDVSGCM